MLDWRGSSLRTLLHAMRETDRTLGAAFAISVGIQLLEALAAITTLGITHCEVRPDHLLVAADGTVTLIDFGYARSPEPETHARTSPARQIERWRFRYLSPEQVRGLDVDARTDVFSAAGVISELVADEHPVPYGDTVFETIHHVVSSEHAASAELPAQLRVPLQLAFAHAPEQRPTATDLRDALVLGARRARIEIGPHVIAQRLVELGVPA